MATVVPTSEEDAALSVVRFTSELAWADAGPEVFLPNSSLYLPLSSALLCVFSLDVIVDASFFFSLLLCWFRYEIFAFHCLLGT